MKYSFLIILFLPGLLLFAQEKNLPSGLSRYQYLKALADSTADSTGFIDADSLSEVYENRFLLNKQMKAITKFLTEKSLNDVDLYTDTDYLALLSLAGGENQADSIDISQFKAELNKQLAKLQEENKKHDLGTVGEILGYAQFATAIILAIYSLTKE